ncbi:MAG: peptidylprolyl isomerase [Lewinellaceae bacterium]|nr:peptidylprolyl isomerase [Saprospiraceae bacterium]MCB9338002.1 peptidylprolyl isomerase [Lewinellaceae bacterium]
MALISQIRKQKWLLVGSLAAALFLFIAMLMFDNPNQSFFGGSQTLLGDINGRKVDYREFSQVHEMLYRNAGGDGFSDRTSLWNYFVDEAIVEQEAQALGLGVSKTELLELQFGDDRSRLSPIISSRYVNQSTQQLDREQLNQLKDIITSGKVDQMISENKLIPDFKYRWAHQEKEVIKDRLQTKITNMVAKAMYTPTWMAEMIGNAQGETIDFLYVQVPFDEIQNSEVTLSDDDFKAYFNENKNQFKQDQETRKVEYAVFNVLPTAKDSADIRQRIADLAVPFAEAENDSLFVENNYGTIDAAYFKKDALSAAIADTIFKMANGTVYGPYLDLNTYKAVKLLDKKVIPDSVKARHILLRAEDQNGAIAANKTIDSLKALLETGAATFDSLAAKFSQDPSNASKGGDLGFFAPGTMVKPFNDVAFFEAEIGKVYKVFTQFGIHLIEVTDRKFGSNPESSVKVAYLSQDIIPSQATQDAVREEALQLQEENTTLEALRKSAAAKGIDMETSPALKRNDYAVGSLGAGQGSRELVRWTFGVDPSTKPPKVGDVSPEVYSFQNQGEFYVSKYAVAGLKSIRPAGIPTFAEVKDEIEPQVINRKKGEMIKAKMAGKTDLGSIAGSFSVQVDTATSVSFASAFIQKAGAAEPKVVAKAFKVDLNQLSEPLVGNTGVFVVKPTNKPPVSSAANIAQVRQSSQATTRGTARARLIQSLRSSADIEDNRSKFF